MKSLPQVIKLGITADEGQAQTNSLVQIQTSLQTLDFTTYFTVVLALLKRNPVSKS